MANIHIGRDGNEEISSRIEIDNLRELANFWAGLPEGTKSDGLPSDLEAGNFETASVELPSGTVIEVAYSGPVAEGYVSPFESAS